jgi:hypothetical protein
MKTEKKLWTYESDDGGHKVNVTEIEKGVLFAQPEGVITLHGSEMSLEFYKEYADTIGRKISLLSDNSKVIKTDVETRTLLKQFVSEDAPFSRIALLNNSTFFNSLLNLISFVVKPIVPYKSFSDIDEAIIWLKEAQV